MNFLDLKTRFKLWLGFGSILIMTTLVTMIAVWGLRRNSQYSKNVSQLEKADAFYLNCRLNGQIYITGRDTSNFNTAMDYADKVVEELNTMIETTVLEEHRETGKQQLTMLANYRVTMAKLKTVIMQEVGYLDACRAKCRAIQGATLTTKQRNLLMETQINIVRGRAYDNFSYLDAAKENARSLSEELTGETKVISKELLAQIDNYDIAANEYLRLRSQVRKEGAEFEASLAAQADELNSLSQRLMVSSITGIVFFAIAALILGLLFSNFITRYLVNAINAAMNFAHNMAIGNLKLAAPEKYINRKDEIGDLTRQLEDMRSKISRVVEGVHESAENVSTASTQSNTSSQQMSEGANEQASGVEEISSTMEEIASNIQQNTENALKAKQLSTEISKAVNIVGQGAIDSLASIQKINDKIGIINDIAKQTNILALNAAVESARAGEHGRGFAVVAAEVRKLAENSRTAADEIVDLTQNSLSVTDESVTKMKQVVVKISDSNTLIQEIAAASAEQNNGVEQVNNAIQELNRVTQQNAAVSEELASSSEELSSQADQLKEMIAFFKI